MDMLDGTWATGRIDFSSFILLSSAELKSKTLYL